MHICECHYGDIMCCKTYIRPTPPSTIPPSSFATQQNEDKFEDNESDDIEFEDDQVSLIFSHIRNYITVI